MFPGFFSIDAKVAYLGWSYSGNTSQAADDSLLSLENTVEARLIESLLKLRLISSLSSAQLSRCGRTDKGVSAWANVVALVVRSALSGPAAQVPKKRERERRTGKNVLSRTSEEEKKKLSKTDFVLLSFDWLDFC